MSKIRIKGEVTYSVSVDQEIDAEALEDKEKFEKEICFRAWEMIKNGNFSGYDISYNKII